LGQFFQTDPIAPLPFCLVRQLRAALYCRVMPVVRKKRVSKKGAKSDLVSVFAALRQILELLGDGELTVQTDKAGNYHKEIPSILYRGKPLYFAGVRQGKNYVSYYLMSAYYDGDMVKGMLPALKKRKQGKACFNFTVVDQECFAELGRLTVEGLKRFRSPEFRQMIESRQ